jgi:hypothetical protein
MTILLILSDPNCGACGVNCGAVGEHCCGGRCADLDDDFFNCGACGHACDDALPYEYGVCFDGTCYYDCVEGAVDCGCPPGTALCDGYCTNILWHSANCGACGNVCQFPFVCSSGACVDPVCQFVEC